MAKKNETLSLVLNTLTSASVENLLTSNKKNENVCKEIIANLDGKQLAELIQMKVKGIKVDLLATRVDALVYADIKTFARIYRKYPLVLTIIFKEMSKPESKSIFDEDSRAEALDKIMELLTAKRVGDFAEALSNTPRKYSKWFATYAVRFLADSRSRKTILKKIAEQWIPFIDKKDMQKYIDLDDIPFADQAIAAFNLKAKA